MNFTGRVVALSLCAVLSGCATPPAVKEALVSIDNSYNANAKLIDQYQELNSQINERLKKWYLIGKSRALLDLALEWCATDPVSIESPEMAASLVDEVQTQLGDSLVADINTLRLRALPERRGNEKLGFSEGTGDMDHLVRGIPYLIASVQSKAEQEYLAIVVDANIAGFESYKRGLAELKRINSTVKQYLDIDVTVKSSDVKEIADAIKKLK